MMQLRFGIRTKIWIWLGAAACLSGCGDTSRETDPPASPAWQQSLEGEGLRIRVESDRIAMNVTDRLSITFHVDAGVGPMRELRIEPVDADAWVVHDVDQVAQPRSSAAAICASIILEPYIPGKLQSPSFRLTPIFADGVTGRSISTEPFDVAVSSVLSEGDTDPAEAKGVVDPPPHPLWRRPLVLTILAGAAGIIVLGCAMWMIARRRATQDPELPSHLGALARLDELRDSGLLHPDSMDRFYLRLSEILRWYIERRFGINAPDSTTEEFLQSARYSNAFVGNDLDLLERFLTHCDQVKFARARVGVDQGERSLETVRRFIARCSGAVDLQEPEIGGVA